MDSNVGCSFRLSEVFCTASTYDCHSLGHFVTQGAKWIARDFAQPILTVFLITCTARPLPRWPAAPITPRLSPAPASCLCPRSWAPCSAFGAPACKANSMPSLPASGLSQAPPIWSLTAPWPRSAPGSNTSSPWSRGSGALPRCATGAWPRTPRVRSLCWVWPTSTWRGSASWHECACSAPHVRIPARKGCGLPRKNPTPLHYSLPARGIAQFDGLFSVALSSVDCRWGYFDSTISPLRSQALMVFLARPVRRSISLIGRPSRRCSVRIFASVPTLITP